MKHAVVVLLISAAGSLSVGGLVWCGANGAQCRALVERTSVAQVTLRLRWSKELRDAETRACLVTASMVATQKTPADADAALRQLMQQFTIDYCACTMREMEAAFTEEEMRQLDAVVAGQVLGQPLEVLGALVGERESPVVLTPQAQKITEACAASVMAKTVAADGETD
jgi:hypothetical protein